MKISAPVNCLGLPLEAALTQIPADITSLTHYRQKAQHHVESGAWAHIESGADQGLTLAHNRSAFDSIRLRPEPFADLSTANTRQILLNQPMDWPVMLAPLAYQRLVHPEGELASARAAMAMRCGMIASTLSSHTLEEIALAAHSASQELGRTAPLWFQLYSQPDPLHTLELIERAEKSGYQAIVWTIDAAIKRSSYPLPAGVQAANLRHMPQYRQSGDLMSEHILFGTPLVAQVPSWEDLRWLRQQTKLPLIIKGILSPDAARKAVDMGADALVVSNHGGRVLDGAMASIEALPAIRAAVGAQFPLLLDSGIRQGTDVFKALALGANAVLVGRPQMHALAVAGMLGVAHMLHLLRAELELTMAQMGCAALQQISPAALYQPGVL